MKKPLILIISSIACLIYILAILVSCDSGCSTSDTKVKYCLDIKLVDGTLTKDTFELYRGTKLEIASYKGAYYLRITSNSLAYIYDYIVIYENTGLLRAGVIDYKVNNIIDPQSSLKE